MIVLYLASCLAMAAPLDAPAPVDAQANVPADAPTDAATDAPVAAPEAPAAPTVTDPPRFVSDHMVELRGISNDVFGAGEYVYVRESIGDNAYLAGKELHVDAPVMGDLFAAGESVHIDAAVHGDVYSAGQDVFIGPNGRVDGHLIATGALVHVGGPVRGDLLVGAGKVDIAAPVSGDVRAEVGELVLSTGGHVGGDLVYTAPSEVPSADASVDGRVLWTQGDPTEERQVSWLGSIASWGLWTGWSYLAQLIVGAVLLLLLGKSGSRAARILAERPSLSLGVGVASFVLLPIVSVLAIALLIPLPLGVFGLALFIALLYVGQLVAAQAVGDMLLRRFRPGAVGRPVMSMAIGLVPVVLLASLPWVGALIGLTATVVGIGAILLWTRELRTA